ncbi:MAG: HDOD domain-containing protein, partial [Bdellovibrionales bacterium]|nr:HDOD domain-containing protein [Bdellovibrionales bacterium]
MSQKGKPTESSLGAAPHLNRNLAQACKKIHKDWFPVNSALLSRIQEGLGNGAYELDVDFLVNDIKTDFALYTYCLNELRKQTHEGIELPRTGTPTELLQEAGLKRLSQILDTSPADISPYSLDALSGLHGVRMSESMLGASTAEVLSERRNLSATTGYSTGLLRQLGLTLISWNYPDAFQEAMEQHKKGKRIDHEITRILGFSPSILGIALARQWGLSSEIRLAIGDHQAVTNLSSKEASALRGTASMLGKICEIGEAFARANHPEHYPSAQTDWDTAQKSIKAILGHDGIKVVKEKVKENCSNYLALAPEVFQAQVQQDVEKEIASKSTTESFRLNRYIRHCPRDTQAALADLYEELDLSPKVDRDLIARLVREIVPPSGFENGCVFLLEPETMKLHPRLKIGALPLNTFKPYHALSMPSTRTGDTNPILAAYHCNTPIVESNYSLTPTGSACIAMVLGQTQRVGVLYLEPN